MRTTQKCYQNLSLNKESNKYMYCEFPVAFIQFFISFEVKQSKQNKKCIRRFFL